MDILLDRQQVDQRLVNPGVGVMAVLAEQPAEAFFIALVVVSACSAWAPPASVNRRWYSSRTVAGCVRSTATLAVVFMVFCLSCQAISMRYQALLKRLAPGNGKTMLPVVIAGVVDDPLQERCALLVARERALQVGEGHVLQFGQR
jgi:hypothetical protein